MNDLNRNISNLKDNVVDFSGNDYIDTLVKYLQAAALPKYREYAAKSKNVIPPMVAVRYGNGIFIKGVINGSVTVTYQKPILWDDKYAVVDVSFTISEVDPYDAETVVQEGSFRGITRSFKDGIFKSTSDSPTYSISSTSNSNGKEELTSTRRTRSGNTESKRKVSGSGTTKSSGGGRYTPGAMEAM